MVVPIILYGSPILRKHSFAVTRHDDLQQLSQDLFDTVKKSGGIGLAAPQAGLLKRAFVIDTSPFSKDDQSIHPFEQIFINPQIISQSADKNYYEEGCLSIPGIFEEVLRPEKIAVRYFDVNFNLIEEELNGIKARIFQHEFDHLDGILFIDKVNPLKRKLLANKLFKMINL
jgi:peptide deformylase